MVAIWDRVESLSAKQRWWLLRGGGVAIALITLLLVGQLLYQSLSTSFSRYQAYQDNILALRQLETDFNQEILQARYELFASYDDLVRNLADQERLHGELLDRPRFMSANDQQDIQRIVEERQAALEQKDNLSEWFKSRNALLKNSLRSLPFLTEQLETSIAAARLTSASQSEPSETSADSTPTTPESSSPSTTPPPPTAQISTLTTTLNQLIRNLLLYNASADEALADRTETLIQKIATLENRLEVSDEAIPINVFRSHANVILTTKPLVEELTGQLLLPLGQHTDALEATAKRAYSKANRLTTLYRTLTLLWFVFVLLLANLLFLRRYRYRDPAFERYQQQVETLAEVATGLQAAQMDTSHAIADAALLPLLQQKDGVGHLAATLRHWSEDLKTSRQAAHGESFVFLSARLSFLVKNRRKLLGAAIHPQLKETFALELTAHNCRLVDIQFEPDQVQVLFAYPEFIHLPPLTRTLKDRSAKAVVSLLHAPELASELASELAELASELGQQPEDIWSETYLITSCETPAPKADNVVMAVQGEEA